MFAIEQNVSDDKRTLIDYQFGENTGIVTPMLLPLLGESGEYECAFLRCSFCQ
jgi:hypothetical protein